MHVTQPLKADACSMGGDEQGKKGENVRGQGVGRGRHACCSAQCSLMVSILPASLHCHYYLWRRGRWRERGWGREEGWRACKSQQREREATMHVCSFFLLLLPPSLPPPPISSLPHFPQHTASHLSVVLLSPRRQKGVCLVCKEEGGQVVYMEEQ